MDFLDIIHSDVEELAGPVAGMEGPVRAVKDWMDPVKGREERERERVRQEHV